MQMMGHRMICSSSAPTLDAQQAFYVPAEECKLIHQAHYSALSNHPMSYHEAVDVLYSEIDFTFTTYRRFILFTRSIPPSRLASIKRITIENTGLRWGPFIRAEWERYRRNYEYDDFFTAIASLPRLAFLDLVFVAQTWHVHPYKRGDDIELLDEVEQRCNGDGAEVWYIIRASQLQSERLREWEYDRKKDRVSWTRWKIHPYQHTRLW